MPGEQGTDREAERLPPGAEGYAMEGPHIQIASTGAAVPLLPDVTTIGRGSYVDVRLTDPSVSVLHAEMVRRGPYVYVCDLGLSRNGTRVNGRLVARKLLADGDALAFGSARCRIAGVTADETTEAELPRSAAPELTRRELDVIASLCRPAMCDEAFVAPATAREIAADLVVTEAAVKQHLLRLYSKLKIPEGQNRRIRLANEVVALGLAKPQMPDEPRGLPHGAPQSPQSAQGTWSPAAADTTAAARPPRPAQQDRDPARDRRRVTGRTGGPA